VDWHSLDWADIFRRLTLFAFRRRQLRRAQGSLADAEDLAAEAIRRFIDCDHIGPDLKLEADVLRQLGSIVNGLLSNELRTVRARKERSLSDPAIYESVQRQTASEDGVAVADECRQALSMLEARVANDEVLRRLLPLESDGITKAASQAAHLNLTINVIYKARRRLAAHREAVRIELGNDGNHESDQPAHRHPRDQ